MSTMPDAARSDRIWNDPHTLLCEACGYVIEGLPSDGPCPECGRPIARSLPENRPGTPWQNLRGWRPMLTTWWLAMRHPLCTLDMLTANPPRYLLLRVLAGGPLGLLLATLLLLVFERESPTPGGGSQSWSPGSALGAIIMALVLGVVLTPVAAWLLGVLTWTEARGLVIISARRGTRVHSRLAHSIVRHGAVAWLFCGVGAAMAIPWLWGFESEWRIERGPMPAWTFALAIVGLGVAFIGFMTFEMYAWLGLRRCKFANIPNPNQTGLSVASPTAQGSARARTTLQKEV